MKPKQQFKVMTYNIQVAMGGKNLSHHVMRSWHHFLPHPERQENLDQIAKIIEPFDVVALQELDAGSLRSNYINQIDYLAELGGFHHSQHQTTRNLGPFAQHSKGMLSRLPILDYHHYILPSRLPGRGVTTFIVGGLVKPVFVVNAHLSLGKRAQKGQLSFIADLIAKHQHVIVLGDFNLSPEELNDSPLTPCKLTLATQDMPTYPSWKPKKQLDYILVSPSLKVKKSGAIDCMYSDHLPLYAELEFI